MDLRQHGQDALHGEAEVCDTEPGDLAVTELYSNVLCLLVDPRLVDLLLLVILVVAGLLLLQIFLILILQLLLLLGGHDLQETERSRQILQVLLDQLQLVNVLIDIVVPVSQ